jgi:hypothetical protein
MALRVTCPWVRAEIEFDISLFNESEFIAWRDGGFRFKEVALGVDVGGGGITDGGEEMAGWGGWRTGAAVGFPDVAVVLPVSSEISQCSGDIPCLNIA